MSAVIVLDYDSRWPEVFEALRSRVWAVVSDVATSIEHVGSTAVPGLAAKPVIDLDVIVSRSDVAAGIDRLAQIGYVHRGNLGIADREAFRAPAGLPRHHLYLCAADGLALKNHLAVRDHLRAHPEVAAEYGALKKRLARQFPDDIDGYVEGKTTFLLGILEATGVSPDRLATIEQVNRLGPASRERP